MPRVDRINVGRPRPDQIGKLLLACDIGLGVSPGLRAVVPTNDAADEIVTKLNDAIFAAIDSVLGDHEYELPLLKNRGVVNRSGLSREPYLIKSAEEQAEERAVRDAKWEEHQRTREEQYEKWLDEHPDNGKMGWWKVEGIRHSALVKADSIRGALKLAREKGGVGDWESSGAVFIGENLPDAIPLN